MKSLDLLSDDEIQRIISELGKTEWCDGRHTATGSAKDRKKNQQITETDPVMRNIFLTLKQLIVSHASLRYTAFPRKVVNIRAARYSVGDAYGWHVDQAIMEGSRADISFTIFLNPKESYEGGELEFDFGTHKFMLKGEKGQMIFYPTSVLHQVRPVTKGERLVIVGWIESMIPIAEDRDSLIIMFQEISNLRKKFDAPTEFDKLNQAAQHMVRMASR